MQTVTPYLLYEDGAVAIDWLTRAFGFRELDRTTGAAGGLHAEMETSAGGGQTSLTYVLVDNVDAHYTRAKEAATPRRPPG